MTPAGNRSRRRCDEGETEHSAARPASSAPAGPIKKRDAARTQKLRTIIRYTLERGTFVTGDQVRLATHFGLSRQRVNQLVMLERELMKLQSSEADDDGIDATGRSRAT